MARQLLPRSGKNIFDALSDSIGQVLDAAPGLYSTYLASRDGDDTVTVTEAAASNATSAAEAQQRTVLLIAGGALLVVAVIVATR